MGYNHVLTVCKLKGGQGERTFETTWNATLNHQLALASDTIS